LDDRDKAALSVTLARVLVATSSAAVLIPNEKQCFAGLGRGDSYYLGFRYSVRFAYMDYFVLK
jgi:hypothetical protein